MRFSLLSTFVVALATDGAVASMWYGKAVYYNWHMTELERWLSDHNVPYATPADRKDLEEQVKAHWNDNIVTPYNSWDVNQLQSYLVAKGKATKDGAAKSKDNLVVAVKSAWFETEDQANEAYVSVQDWIFDSWTDSQLKAFCDRNGIPVPQPRQRDSLLKTVRENYQSAAKKVNQQASYPGNWLYDSWSESDLKAWLDERGYPTPQPTSRDKLIASVRRQSRLASDSMKDAQASASASAIGVQQSLTDALIDSWSDSQIKEWADRNGIKVPQGSKRNELVALARKHRARLTGNNLKSSAASAFGAATTGAGNEYARATDGAYYNANGAYNVVLGYADYVRERFGLVSEGFSASASSARRAAASSAYSASSIASQSSSSASSVASRSASSASSKASKKGQETYKAEL